MYEYWNFHTQLVKVKISSITLESNLKTSNKTEKYKLYVYKLYIHAHKNNNNVYCGIVYKSEKLKTTYISNDRKRDKKIFLFSYDRLIKQ